MTCKDLFVFRRDARAHLQCLLIIGVVITRRQRESAEQDAPLDLFAKEFGARAAIQLADALELRRTAAEAHAVKPGEVGGRLRAGQHIVCRERRRKRGEGDLLHHRARGLQLPRRGQHRRLDLGIQALAEEFPRKRHAKASHAAADPPGKILRRSRGARSVPRVLSRDRRQHRRVVRHAGGDGPHLVERGGERHKPIARHAAIGGL